MTDQAQLSFCIADPPYLGRGDRWYGDGRGSGRTDAGTGRNGRKPDRHPGAAEWDDPTQHVALARRLDAGYDGWAIACAASTVSILLDAVPGARLAVWVRPNAMPGGSRIINTWEGVVYRTPRLARAGLTVRDALVAPVRRQGFLGSKPPEWTRWVLALLGASGVDEIVDAFPGSGAVQHTIDGLLPLSEVTGTIPV